MYATLRIASWSRRRVWLAITACLITLPSFAPAASTWIPGGDFNWGTASNWSPPGVPNDANTDVIIGSAFANLNMDATVRDLSLNAYLFAKGGTRNLSVQGTFNWTNGWMTDVGTTTLNGTSSLSANALCGLGSARALVNNGAASLSGSSYLNVDPGIVLTNNGTFNFTDGTAWLWYNNSGGALPVFVNTSTGTLAKTAGSGGTNIVTWRLDNAGTIDVQSGTLRFENGGILRNGGKTTGSGTFRIQESAASPSNTRDSERVMTVGTAGTDVFTFGSNVRMEAGMTLTGPGKIVVNGNFDWSNGAVSGTAGMGGLELNGSNNRLRTSALALSRAVVNKGTTSLEGGITVTGSAPASWSNYGTFRFTGDGTLAGSQTFTNNAGATLAKTGGTGTSTVNWTVNNAGLIRADSGTLQLAGGFSQSSAGGVLASGGAVTFASPITVQGGLAGTGSINAATINHSNGTIAPGLSAGTLTINGNLNLASSSILASELGSGGSDKLVVNGNLILDGIVNIIGVPADFDYPVTFTLIDYSGTLTNNGLEIGSTPTDRKHYSIEIDAVNTLVLVHAPEPSTVALGIGLGLMGAILAWRKRRTAR